MKSLSNIATSGMMKAIFLFPNIAPPNNAIAAIGVKLKGCGSKRLTAATRMAILMNRNRGVNIFDFIFSNFVNTNLHKSI